MKAVRRGRAAGAAAAIGVAASLALAGAPAACAGAATADLAPMPASTPADPAMVELGRYFFFDYRLSGDRSLSCASCHDPRKGWGDGQALSKAYSSMAYFRNAPTVVNARHRARFLWDGRLDGADRGTLVRDMITEAHFMNMDSRLMQERLSQVPEYEAMWKQWRGDDINGMRVYTAIGEFIGSLATTNAAFDRYLKGDAGAISEEAREGYALFKGKAGCASCHNGPIGSDGKLHKTGVPEHPDVMRNPLRAITLLRHYSTSGLPNYMNARTDVGAYAVTKDRRDDGKFLTAQLRELKYTAPYMHNGMFGSLEEVIDFYDRGAGPDSGLKRLGLTAAEKQALKAFLLTLSGEPVLVGNPGQPAYQARVPGRN